VTEAVEGVAELVEGAEVAAPEEAAKEEGAEEEDERR